MYNVDIDTGGTMTDGLVSGNGQTHALKVETTPHDVTIAFIDLLEAARDRLGFETLRAFLNEVEVIRWSSTITSNVLAQLIGPKLGLLVSAGHEADLYDSETAESVIGTLVSADDISGISADADERTVRRAVKSLLDRGIRRINVSLAGAYPDSSAERRIVKMIAEEYPDHFLGSIPALAGSEIIMRPDDATRTVAALVNSYVHPALATTLYRAEGIVRDEHDWQGNVLVGHINGGVTRIGKTKAFDTIESGPLFGTHACAAATGTQGPVLAIDVGGTTTKVSAVEDGEVVQLASGNLFDIPVELDMPLLRSIALGGGSVARIVDGKVTLGPDSMGAAPGPACYGLGGRNATVTDAFLAAGVLSPTAFLGGRRTLDVAKAREVLSNDIGTLLGLDPDAAALAVLEAAWELVATLARDAAAEAGWDPAACTIYGYGGNGPLFAAPVAERLGSDRARYFRYGSVYSAYGSAISDVVHVYESALSGDVDLADTSRTLADEARRDLAAEGFDPAQAELTWELRSGEATVRSQRVDPSSLVDSLDGSPTLVRLTATYPLPGLEPQPVEEAGEPTPSDHRVSVFSDSGELPAYDIRTLAGETLPGPALGDGGSYTWLVPAGWSVTVDAYGDAKLDRKGDSV